MVNEDSHKRLRFTDKQRLPTNLPGDNDSYPSELGLFDLNNPDITLFNYIDDELIKLAGSEVWIYKYHQDESFDDLYEEHRTKAFDPYPKVAFGHYDPRPIEEELNEYGLQLNNDQTFTFNKDYIIRVLGRPLIAGDIIKPKFQDTFYEVYEVQEDSFEVYGVFHLRATSKIYRETEGVFFLKPSISEPNTDPVVEDPGEEDGSWYEFAWDHSGSLTAAINLGRDTLYEGDAGSKGFVTVSGDSLVLANTGEEIFLYGVNLTKEACAPPKEDADRVVNRLASFGFNCVRFHLFGTKTNIFSGQESMATFNEDFLDRMDYFVKKLKNQGIYYTISIRDWRDYFDTDNVPKVLFEGEMKAITPSKGRWVNFIHPDVRAIEKDYATRLLSRTNPYTGTKTKNDPALAIVEIMNEDSIIGAWAGEGLDYPMSVTRPGSKNVTEPYHVELDAQYQVWLNRRYTSTEDVKAAWGGLREGETLEGGTIERLKAESVKARLEHATKERAKDILAFYQNMEASTFQDMKDHLTNSVGIQCPIVFTQFYSSPAHQAALVQSDISDDHVYYDHARFGPSQSGEKKANDSIARHNLSYVDNPIASGLEGKPIQSRDFEPTIRALLARQKGKPSFISESLASHVNDYEYEFWPIFVSYLKFYGTNALTAYMYSNSHQSYEIESDTGHLGVSNDPSFLTQAMIMAVAFRKGYISKASEDKFNIIAVDNTEESWVKSYYHLIEQNYSNHWWEEYDIPQWTNLVTPTIRSFTDSEHILDEALLASDDPKVYVSNTGELTFYNADLNETFFRTNTLKFQALVGHISGKETTNLKIKTEDRGSLLAVSLDDKVLSTSKNVLMSVIGGVRGKGSSWTEGGWWDQWNPGTTPKEVRRIDGTLVFGTVNYDTVQCFAIQEDFNLGEEIPLTRETNAVSFNPANYDTPLFLFRTP